MTTLEMMLQPSTESQWVPQPRDVSCWQPEPASKQFTVISVQGRPFTRTWINQKTHITGLVGHSDLPIGPSPVLSIESSLQKFDKQDLIKQRKELLRKKPLRLFSMADKQALADIDEKIDAIGMAEYEQSSPYPSLKSDLTAAVQETICELTAILEKLKERPRGEAETEI